MSHYGLGNYGNYRGNTLVEMLSSKRDQQEAEYAELAYQIIDLVDYAEYERWVDGWSERITHAERMEMAEQYLDDLRNEQCSCSPVDVMECPACRHYRYQYEHGTLPAPDAHLEAAYEDQTCIEF